MAKTLTLEQAGKVLLYLLFAVAALFAGPRFGDRLMFDQHASTAMRIAGITISVLSVVPFLGYVAWGFTVADEYNRQTMLIGTALAFALAILFSMTTQLLADARVVDSIVTINLPIAGLIWFVGLGLAALHARLRITLP